MLETSIGSEWIEETGGQPGVDSLEEFEEDQGDGIALRGKLIAARVREPRRTVFQRATPQAGYQSSGSDEAAQGLAPPTCEATSIGEFGASQPLMGRGCQSWTIGEFGECFSRVRLSGLRVPRPISSGWAT
jgi:hypothetical protein